MAKKSDTDSALEFVIGVMLFIPIAAFFLLKWLFHGIIWLLTALGSQKKPAAGKEPVPAFQSGGRSGLIQKKCIESPVLEEEDNIGDPDYADEDCDDEEEDDFGLWEDEEDEDSESENESYIEEPFEEDQIQAEGSEDITARKDDSGMATIIGAGKYVFGEDLPLGKYDLRVVSGDGGLTIRYGDTEDDENWIMMGKNPDHAQEYRNLSLERGRYFMIDDCLRVEITRSKMLEIEP